MSRDTRQLGETWRVRNAAAASLALSEEMMRRSLTEASVEQLAELIEELSPARSTGPEWTRTFEPLVERLWAWRDDATMADLADTFKKKGMPWLAVTHALSPDHGAEVRRALRHPAWARLPAFAIT